MDVEVLPLSRGGFGGTLIVLFRLDLFELLQGDRLFNLPLEVALGEDQNYGLVLLDGLDLGPPLLNVLKRGAQVASHADHEAVGVLVLHLPVRAQVLVARRIVDLQIHLLLGDVLDAFVHVEHRRLVRLGERVVEVVGDHGRLAHRCVAHQHQLQLLLPACI